MPACIQLPVRPTIVAHPRCPLATAAAIGVLPTAGMPSGGQQSEMAGDLTTGGSGSVGSVSGSVSGGGSAAGTRETAGRRGGRTAGADCDDTKLCQ